VSVFERVDAFFESFSSGQLVTVLDLLIEPRRGTVLVANAGHLPPLLVTAEGATLAAGDSGLPFGVQPDVRRYTELELPPDASLVAVTDGLVERRGEDIDDGLARVLETAGQTSHASARKLLDTLVTGAAAARVHDDDVTVLVLRRR
jgi:serine phosphatase RsbU (regulator of sigma subunit)